MKQLSCRLETEKVESFSDKTLKNWYQEVFMPIINVVQWDPYPNVFAWKFPETELNTNAQLIVREGQEAYFFSCGQAIGPFGPGRHVLNTSNYPVLSSIIKLGTGGVSPFSAEVWFISKAFKLDIKWGTLDPIQVEDPKYHIMLPVRSFGQYGLTVEDTGKFLIKMIGMVPAFVTKVLSDYFRGIILTQTKDLIAKYLVEKNISVLQMSAYLGDISKTIESKISESIAEYGVRVVNFSVNSISTDENDPAVKQLLKALSTKAEMDIVGYNYQQKRSFDTIETAAGNTGNGNMMNAGMGMAMGVGMGMPMGNMMGNMMGGMMNNVLPEPQTQKTCSGCGKSFNADALFCPYCGKKAGEVGCIVCDKCGKQSAAGSKFCSFCGDFFNLCAFCGCDNTEGSAVCRQCGKPMPTKCPACGTLVEIGAKFCNGCGKKMVQSCPACGQEVAPGVAFCSGCGTKLK